MLNRKRGRRDVCSFHGKNVRLWCCMYQLIMSGFDAIFLTILLCHHHRCCCLRCKCRLRATFSHCPLIQCRLCIINTTPKIYIFVEEEQQQKKQNGRCVRFITLAFVSFTWHLCRTSIFFHSLSPNMLTQESKRKAMATNLFGFSSTSAKTGNGCKVALCHLRSGFSLAGITLNDCIYPNQSKLSNVQTNCNESYIVGIVDAENERKV